MSVIERSDPKLIRRVALHLNLFTDYALRSLLYLDWHPGRPCTVDEIAGFFDISADHVTKVMQHLARKGYVRSRRGRHGGAVMARQPEDIRLGDVIRDFEHIALLDCLSADDACVIQPHCRLRHVLAEGQRRMMDYFDRFTLKDLSGPSAPPNLSPSEATIPLALSTQLRP